MQTETDPVARLWSAVRAMFARVRAAVGEAAPETRDLRGITAWLRPIEALVRQIVLIEAAALARGAAPLPKPRAASPAARAQRRQSFRLWPRAKTAPVRIRALGPPVLVRDIWRDRARLARARQLAAARRLRRPAHVRLAGRIEALARIIENPAPAARRLARKLRVSPRLAFTLAARRPPRACRSDPDHGEAGRRAYGAALALNSS